MSGHTRIRQTTPLRHYSLAAAFVMCLLALSALFLNVAYPVLAAQRNAGYYGTPLRFAPPPVDVSGGTVGIDDEGYGSGRDAGASLRDSGGQAIPGGSHTGSYTVEPVYMPVQAPSRAVQNAPQQVRENSQSPVGKPAEQTAPVAGRQESGANAGTPGKKPAAKPIRLFGTVDFRGVLKDLPKWERVLRQERKAPSFIASGLKCQKTQANTRWLQLRDKLRGASLMEKVKGVNGFFNQWPYKTDTMVWGLEDYWATPCEFVVKSGDCEDYAIAKYYALRDLGVPASVMRIAAIKDTIRGIGHAVLVVYMENDAYVLDNLTNLVLSHKRLKHYRPLYTVNEEYLWRHVKPVAGPDSK